MSPRVEGTGPPLPFKGLRTKQPISYPAAHKYDSIKGADLLWADAPPSAEPPRRRSRFAWSPSRQDPACCAQRLVYGLPAGRFSPASTRCPSGATTSGRSRAHRSRSLRRSTRTPAPINRARGHAALAGASAARVWPIWTTSMLPQTLASGVRNTHAPDVQGRVQARRLARPNQRVNSPIGSGATTASAPTHGLNRSRCTKWRRLARRARFCARAGRSSPGPVHFSTLLKRSAPRSSPSGRAARRPSSGTNAYQKQSLAGQSVGLRQEPIVRTADLRHHSRIARRSITD
jgi:hypothetical protein